MSTFLDILKPKSPAPKADSGTHAHPELYESAVKEAEKAGKKSKRANSFLGILTNQALGVPEAARGVLKDIGQGVARTVGTVGIEAGNAPTRIINKVTGKKAPLPFDSEIPTKGNKFTEILFGGKPIRDVQNAGENAVNETNQLASNITGKEVKPVSKKLAIPFGIAGSLLDLTGFGGKAGVKAFTDEVPEQFLKYMAKEKSPTVIEDTLKGIGLDDVNSKSLSGSLAGAKDIDEVKSILINHGKPAEGTTRSFRDILKEPEARPSTVAPVNAPSEVDKLIAEGKIRVVSRNGRDTYQIKKGNEWVNTRDEDSAFKQIVSRETPKPRTQAQEQRAMMDELISMEQEKLDSHPGKKLQQFISTKEGQFMDFANPETAKTPAEKQRRIDRIRKVTGITENLAGGDQFDDPDFIRSLIDDYQGTKTKLQELKEQKRLIKDEPKPLPQGRVEPVKTVTEAPSVRVEQFPGTEGEARSIENQARQAKEILDSGSDESHSDYAALPDIIRKTVTPVEKRVHFIDTFFRTPRYVMEKIGFGNEAKELRGAMDEYWKELPKNIDRISGWIDQVPKESNPRIFKYLDGQAVDLRPEEKRVAIEIQTWLAEWADRLGLPQDNRVSNYITHIFDDASKQEFDEELAKVIADKIPGSVYDPFVLKRLGAKGYREDTWAALQAYVKRATRKVHMDPVLEKIQQKAGGSLEMANIEKSQFKYIQEYISNINMRPSERDESIDNIIKNIFGYKFGARPISRITKTLRQMTFRAMLGLNPASALRNLSQGANTYSQLGEKYTAIGYMSLFKRGMAKELEREGVLNAGFIQDKAYSATKKAIEKADKVLFFLFEKAEMINRGAAYFGAKSKALKMGKTEEEAIAYAKEIVRKTQFSFDSVDTPVALSSDIAKTLTQFQTFGVKQVEYLGGLVKDHQWAALIRYIGAGLLFTYTIGRAFGMKPSDLIPFSNFKADVPVSLKFPAAVGGAILNTPDKYGAQRDTKQKLKDIGKAGLGLIPAGSQIKKTYEGIEASNAGGSFTKDGKLQYEVDTSTKGKVQSALFGKYANDKAQKYFEKEDSNAAEMKAIKPIYDQIQELKEQDPDQAVAVYDELTEEEKASYKVYKTRIKTQETLAGKKAILPVFQDIRAMKDSGDVDGAIAKYDALSEDQKRYYKLVKDQVEKDAKAASGEKPTYKNGEIQTKKGIINTVVLYARALGVDPETAFKAMFSKEQLEYVDGNVAVLKRIDFTGSEGSEAIAQQRAKEQGVDRTLMRLDHTIPRELGGDNSDDNLNLITTEQWKSFTPIENYLGQQVRDKKMKRKTAQDLIRRFKNGEITAEEVKAAK